jgi:hypothetical protein
VRRNKILSIGIPVFEPATSAKGAANPASAARFHHYHSMKNPAKAFSFISGQ